MPENTSPPEENVDNKLSSRSKWRGKLFSGDGKFLRRTESVECNEDEVTSFLRSAVATPKIRSQPAAVPPRLDTVIAPRYSSSANVSQLNAAADVSRQLKVRPSKGLHVTFQTATPEIIGEGGDDATLPPKDVSKSLRSIAYPERLRSEIPHLGMGQEKLAKRSPSAVHDENSEPVPLQRWATRSHDVTAVNDVDDCKGGAELTAALNPLDHCQHQDEERLTHSPRMHFQARFDTSTSTSDDAIEHGAGDRLVDHVVEDNSSVFLEWPSLDSVEEFLIPSLPNRKSHNQQDHPPSSCNFQQHPSLEKSFPQVNARAISGSKSLSLRTFAKGIVEDCLQDFSIRVQRLDELFRLGVSTASEDIHLLQWTRICAWWFISGRSGLEMVVRNKNALPENQSIRSDGHLSLGLKQAYVDLAKAWWITRNVIPRHPEVVRFGTVSMQSMLTVANAIGDNVAVELAEVHLSVVASMRALAMSMKRNGILPPEDFEIQAQDLRILPRLPVLWPDVANSVIKNPFATYTEGNSTIAEPFFPLPVGDTKRHFNYGRMFVEVCFDYFDKSKQHLRMPCLVSVVRGRGQRDIKAVIASQDGQIDLVISDEDGWLNWKNADWKVSEREILIRVSTRFNLRIRFSQKDFKMIWNIYDNNQRVQKDLSPCKDEKLVLERTLQSFQCNASKFPSDALSDCVLRLFERHKLIAGGSGNRRAHDGHRCVVVSPAMTKTLSNFNQELGKKNPMLFGFQRSGDNLCLTIRILPSMKLSLGFHDVEDNERFRRELSGTLLSEHEVCSTQLPIQTFGVNKFGNSETLAGSGSKLDWKSVSVINNRPFSHDNYGRSSVHTVCSDALRVLVKSDIGTLVDRMNLAPGELQINLSIDKHDEINLLRPQQQDLTLALEDDKASKENMIYVRGMLQSMATLTTIRTYQFHSVQDLHTFQTLVTGYNVVYDGYTVTFAIARGRMVVPIHKKWEASRARLQIVKQGTIVQLVGFFKDFAHGASMNFVLKFTDIFETFTRSGTFYLRIVDAKFALPKVDADETKDYVSLDMPDYPGEHDDITIGFDNEQEMNRVAEALPAPVNRVSRMASLRR